MNSANETLPNKICVNCKFFHKQNRDEGDCRRHSAIRGNNQFPIVSNDTWCGQYKRGVENVSHNE